MYSTWMDELNLTQLTPYNFVDYSPTVTQTRSFIAILLHKPRPWNGENSWPLQRLYIKNNSSTYSCSVQMVESRWRHINLKKKKAIFHLHLE